MARLTLFCFLLSFVFSSPAFAQQFYGGAEYTKLNFKSNSIAEHYDSLNSFYGIEDEHRGLELGTFTTLKEDRFNTSTRLLGLSLDGFLYSDEWKGAKAFVTTGTVIMDAQIEGLGNNTKIFPRAGGGVQYKLTDKWSLRAITRYTEDWSYSFGFRRIF